MEKTNKNSRLKWCVLGVLIALCVIYFAVPSVNAYINKISAVLGSANVDAVIEFMHSYGPYAMAISFFLMVFSSVAAPLPAFLITFANAAIFGWWQGAILSWSSAMAGAAVCFFIARVLGRDTVERFAGKGHSQHRRLFQGIRFKDHTGMPPAALRVLRRGELLCGPYAYKVLAVLHSHRHRTAARHHRLFLRRRHADWRRKVFRDGAVMYIRNKHYRNDNQGHVQQKTPQGRWDAGLCG